MRRWTRLELLILTVNTVGFLAYLAWLIGGSERIFYTQDGVLYLLPCLPFFFVFAFLGGRHKGQAVTASGMEEEGHEDG